MSVTVFISQYAGMAEQIKVDCDYDTLTGHSYTAWGVIANYQVTIIESLPGYTKFKIHRIPFGDLGMCEVKKSIDGCIVTFSNLSVVDDYEEWLKQTRQEIHQTTGEDDEFRLLGPKIIQKMKVAPEFHKAKQKAWKETIDIYKGMIVKLQSGSPAKSAREMMRELAEKYSKAFRAGATTPPNTFIVNQETDMMVWSLYKKAYELGEGDIEKGFEIIDMPALEKSNDPLIRALWERAKKRTLSDDPIERAFYGEMTNEDIIARRNALTRELLQQPLMASADSIPEAAKQEMPKQRGRYRLTDHDIKFRRQKVREANKVKRDNPQKQWKEIDKQFAEELEISDRTFRSWRHSNY